MSPFKVNQVVTCVCSGQSDTKFSVIILPLKVKAKSSKITSAQFVNSFKREWAPLTITLTVQSKALQI